MILKTATVLVTGLLLIASTGCHFTEMHRPDLVWNGNCGAGCNTCSSKACLPKAKACDSGHCGSGLLGSSFMEYFHCADGCGEVYWGEWISDPPDCCDPCDPCYGCWTGPQQCCQRVVLDPLLWLLKLNGKQCRPNWQPHGIPSSGCHYLDCANCQSCGLCDCNCSSEKTGVVGDYVPQAGEF